MTISVIGKWRIVEAVLWERGYLDLVEPAHITFGDRGHGEFAFGCVTGGMKCKYNRSIIQLTWTAWTKPQVTVPRKSTTERLKSKPASDTAAKPS